MTLNDVGKLKGELKEDIKHLGWLKKRCEVIQIAEAAPCPIGRSIEESMIEIIFIKLYFVFEKLSLIFLN